MPTLIALIKTSAAFVSFFTSLGYSIDKIGYMRGELGTSIVNRAKQAIHQGDGFLRLFLDYFDGFFKPNEKTLRPRISRSIIASCVVLILFLCLWLVFFHDRAENAMDILKDDQAFTGWSGIFSPLAFLIGANLIGDFFSLWESRFVMEYMAKVRLRFQVLLLFMDLVLTILIYCFGLVIGGLLVITLEGKLISSIEFVIGWIAYVFSDTYQHLVVNQGLLFCKDVSTYLYTYDLMSIYFYTILFTSVWLWVFLIGIKTWSYFSIIGRASGSNNYPMLSFMCTGSVFISFLLITTGIIIDFSQFVICN